MRIAFVTFEYPPFIIGGAGIYAKNVTEELAKLGHEVVVFTPEIKTSEETYNKGDIDVKRIKLNEKLPFKALQFWLRLPSVLKEIDKKEKFDVIHFNGISYWSLKKRLSNEIWNGKIFNEFRKNQEKICGNCDIMKIGFLEKR